MVCYKCSYRRIDCVYTYNKRISVLQWSAKNILEVFLKSKVKIILKQINRNDNCLRLKLHKHIEDEQICG